MSLEKTTISDRVRQRANIYGFKEANLFEIDQVAQQLQASCGRSFRVPVWQGVSHDDVYSFLSAYQDDQQQTFDGHYQQFCQLQTKKDSDQGLLNPAALEQLACIRRFIIGAFSESTIKINIEKLKEIYTLIVRSTGKEDNEELANPGGNASVPHVKNTPADITAAMGVVVASYFSEKSMIQRLLGNDDITSVPFMPVLIQEMIGASDKLEDVVMSGVMYTGKHNTLVQMAPGQGELVVNSKAPFDSFSVSSDLVVYSDIQEKTVRLAPANGAVVMKKNNTKLKYAPSVNSQVIRELAIIGLAIEEHFGRQQDVELVAYPVKEGGGSSFAITIVQSRPIQNDKSPNVSPSSVPPHKVDIVRQQAKSTTKAVVITPAKSAVKIITDPAQLIMAEDMPKALDIYLYDLSPEEKVSVKAVLVEKEAARTSHEAAQFNLMSIPALALKSVSDIKQIFTADKDQSGVVIVDPQRSQIIDWSNNCTEKDVDLEAILFNEETGILQNGFFKSTLPARQLVQPQQFNFNPSRLPEHSIDSQRPLGLILDAIEKQSDEQSFAELMNKFKVIGLMNPENVQQLEKTTMNTLIEKIEAANYQTDNKEAIEALQKLLLKFYHLNQKHPLNMHEIFQHAMISGLDIYRCLVEVGGCESEQASLPFKRELLDLTAKMQGLVYYPGQKGVVSSSVNQAFRQQMSEKKALEMVVAELRREKTRENAATLLAIIGDKSRFSLLVDTLRFGEVSSNSFIQTHWDTFVIAVSKKRVLAKVLATVVAKMQRQGLGGEWMNKLFLAKLSDAAQVTLKGILSESNQILQEIDQLGLEEIEQVIDAWERRIDEWSEPSKFNQLERALQVELLPLIDQLNLNRKAHYFTQTKVIALVRRLTECIDQSIKVMKGSPLYLEQDSLSLQMQRFSQMLELFQRIMVKWMAYTNDYVSADKSYVVENCASSQEEILAVINEHFQSLTKAVHVGGLSQEELLRLSRPSKEFRVDRLVYGSVWCDATTAWFAKYFQEIQSKITLEDMYTLFHENTLNLLSGLEPKIPLDLSKIVPAPLLNFKSLFSETAHQGSDYLGCGKVRGRGPFFKNSSLSYNYFCTLGKHNYEMDLSYDRRSDQLSFSYCIVDGGGGDEHKRYTDILFMADLLCRHLVFQDNGVRIVSQPTYQRRTVDFSLTMPMYAFDDVMIELIHNMVSRMAVRTFAEGKRGDLEMLPACIALNSDILFEAVNRDCSSWFISEVGLRIGDEVNALNSEGDSALYVAINKKLWITSIEALLLCPLLDLHQVDKYGHNIVARILQDKKFMMSDLLFQSVVRNDRELFDAVLQHSDKACKSVLDKFYSYLINRKHTDICMQVACQNDLLDLLLQRAVGENYKSFFRDYCVEIGSFGIEIDSGNKHASVLRASEHLGTLLAIGLKLGDKELVSKLLASPLCSKISFLSYDAVLYQAAKLDNPEIFDLMMASDHISDEVISYSFLKAEECKDSAPVAFERLQDESNKRQSGPRI